MSVSITVANTIDGTPVADALSGGDSGIDLGTVTNGNYAPLVDKNLNQGSRDLYIFHDAVVDPITDLKSFIAQFSGTYGGADSAANDYALVKSIGNTSGNSKNNGDGNSSGIWIAMDADASDTNNFDVANFPTLNKIYGDNVSDGTDLANAFVVNAQAMVYESGGEQNATSPVDGQVGISGDTTLGDNAHVQLRIYLAEAFTQGGIIQVDWTLAFSYTA